MAGLRKRDAPSAFALELIILTASRSGEVRGMRWREVDFDAALWTVPKERMKGNRPHRVPLSDPALTILHCLWSDGLKSDDLIFPSRNATPLSDMVFAALLRRWRPHRIPFARPTSFCVPAVAF